MATAAPSLALLGMRRQFHQLPLRFRILISQLPIFCVTLLICLAAALFHSEGVLNDPLFLAGMALVVLLTIVAAVVNWDALPYPTYWVLPLLDFVVVGLISAGGSDSFDGLPLLAAFPVFWLAWSGVAPLLAKFISVLAPAILVWMPLFTRPGAVTLEELSRPVVIPVMMLGLAIAAGVMSLSMDERDAEVTALLAETRKRERMLDTVLNTVGVGVVVVDKDGHDVLMNAQQKTNHRIAKPSDVADPSEDQLLVFGPDRVTKIPAQLRPVRRAVLGESFSDELVWVGTGKDQKALSTSARAMRTDDGSFDGSVIAFADVTAMVDALSAKDDFVASVTHELRTPLTSIIGYLDLALDDELPESASRGLAVAQRNAERLLQLVSDLLSTAAGDMKVDPRPADLADVVHCSVSSASPRAAEAGVVLVNELPESLPMFLDPDRMAQVVDNLLSNAVKYSPGGGVVTLSASVLDDPGTGGTVVLEVRDTGMGIAKEDLPGVFTKFFRSGAVRQAAIPGVGLGLAISKYIVEAHGGSITVASEPGRGTVFTVCLPVKPEGAAGTQFFRR